MISKLRSTSWRTRRSATNRSKIQSSRIRLNVGDRLKNVVSLEPRIALWRHQNTVSAWASMLSRILGLRASLLDDIDRASEPIREQILHAHQIEQVECRGWIDVNQYIDVAVRPRLTTHDRPEHGGRRDTALPQLRLKCLQRGDDLALVGVTRRFVQNRTLSQEVNEIRKFRA